MTALPKKSFNVLYPALLLYGIATLISMAAMSLGVALVLIAMVIHAIQGRGFRPLPSRAVGLAWASLALGAAGVVSLVVAEVWPLAYGGHTAAVLWVRALAKLLYLFWPLVLALALQELDAARKERVLLVWLGVFGVLSVLGVTQFFTGWPRPQPIPTMEGRYHVTLFLGHHLSVASVLIFPLFFAMNRAIDRGRQSFKPIYGLIAVLGVAALFLTYSRMAWIALPVALGAYTLWALKKKHRVIAILALAVIGGSLLLIPAVQERLGWKYGVWQRQELWRANWAFLHERPLTGVGLLSNHELSGHYLMKLRQLQEVFSGHAHNNVIDILGGMGVLGLVAWLFWWTRVLQVFWQSPQRMAWICAAVAYHINGLTQVNFWEGKVFHTLAWVIAWAIVSGDRTKGRTA